MENKDCSYILLQARYSNSGGHKPCGTCPGCVAEREAHDRNVRWTLATTNGANPKR